VADTEGARDRRGVLVLIFVIVAGLLVIIVPRWDRCRA
jgi:hypothetical protein